MSTYDFINPGGQCSAGVRLLAIVYVFLSSGSCSTNHCTVVLQVSSYDLINPGGQYSARVRLLGSYHPQLAAQADQTDGQDIDDPLYGNVGGEEEQVGVCYI